MSKMTKGQLPPLLARKRIPFRAKRVTSRVSGSHRASARHTAGTKCSSPGVEDASTAADVGGRWFRKESHGMPRTPRFAVRFAAQAARLVASNSLVDLMP